MTRAGAIFILQPIMGDKILIEHSYFSPMRRTQWFVGFRNNFGAPVVRGQGNTLREAVEDVERFYAQPTKRK